MAINTRKRGRSRSPPSNSNKRMRLSPSDETHQSNRLRIKPASSSSDKQEKVPVHKPISLHRSPSPLPEPKVRSVIQRPPPIQNNRTPPSPINFSRRANSPERIQRRLPSPIRISRRALSPVRARRRSRSPVRVNRRIPSPIRVRQRTPSPVQLPAPEPVQIEIPRVVRNNRARDLVVSIKNQPIGPQSIRILKLEGVSNNIALSRLVHELIVEVSTIIGCHRVADYEAQICDSIVFLYLTSEKEFNALLSLDYLLIEGCIINISDPKLIYGHAKYIIPYGTASSYDMRMSPHPMGLFGFRQLPTTTTFYVIAVLRELEQEGNITGFRLAFCERRKVTRNFGFVTFLNRQNAFKILNKKLNIMGDEIEVKLPTGMPFLIEEDRKHLLANNRCEFSEDIRTSNWLNVNFLNRALPMRPLPFGQIFQPVNAEPIAEPPQPKPRCFPSSTPKVIKHDTPPASPTLSIGEDYELDDDGILAVPSSFWLNATAD